MFKPTTEKIKKIYKERKSQVDFLDKKVFKGKTNIYISTGLMCFFGKKNLVGILKSKG